MSHQAQQVGQERDATIASLQQDLEALRRQRAAEEQKAKETLASELDRLDREWASKAALKVRNGPHVYTVHVYR